MLDAIKRFLTAPWRAAELAEALDSAAQDIADMSNTIADLRDLVNNAPSFYEASLRDDKFGTEIAEEVKAEAVKRLAPALSRQYMSILDKIAWTLPPPRSAQHMPPGTVLSAVEAKSRVYHVRIELPALSYDMKMASLD